MLVRRSTPRSIESEVSTDTNIQHRWEDRVFQFFPADVRRPHTLTPDQVAHYNDKGYIKGLRAFSRDRADMNRSYFDGLLSQLRAQGKDSYALNWFHKTCAGIYDICKHPSILLHVKDILGPHIICWGSHFFCKMPHDGKSVSWHQDALYWPLTPTKTVTVWLAIDDADRENGAMRVIPGSHRQGRVPVHDSRAEESNILTQTAIVPEQWEKEAVYFEMGAGEMSMHSDLLLHASSPNDSDRRRCGLTIRYASADVRCTKIPDDPPFTGFTLRGTRANELWNHASIHCLNGDPNGYWADIPRPAGEDVAWSPGELAPKEA
jgi:non-heme Fe2+,alpha-ketoglutarate-dependent halogenase